MPDRPRARTAAARAAARRAPASPRGTGAVEPRTPVPPGPLPQVADLQLAPGVAAVRRVEGAPPGLGQRRLASQERVLLEPAAGLGDGHPVGVQADRAREPGHPQQGLDRDTDHVSRIVGVEALLYRDFLDVMRPALDERLAAEQPARLGRRVPQRQPVREVPRCDLVHGDRRQRGPAEHLQPFGLLVLGPLRPRRGHPVERRRVRLARSGPGHHRHRPLPRLRGRRDHAGAVRVRNQPALGGPGDHLVGQRLRLGDHAVGVGVVAQQLGHQLSHRTARGQPAAGLVQHRPQPVALGLGAGGQRREVDVGGLGGGQQQGQPVGAERGRAEGAVGAVAAVARAVARAGGRLQVRDQPGMRRQRRTLDRVVRVQADRQPAGRGQGGGGDGRGHLVQRGDRAVDRGRPRSQVPGPGLAPLPGRRVLPVVAADVEVRQVRHRVAAVQPQLAVERPQARLLRGDQRLVVRIRQRVAAQRGQAPAHAAGGKVLQPAVVLVPACPLAGLGHAEVTDRTQSGLHAGDPRACLPTAWRRRTTPRRRPAALAGPADTTPVSAGPAALPDAAWTPPASTANGETRPSDRAEVPR